MRRFFCYLRLLGQQRALTSRPCGGLDPDGRMYLLDRWRKQSASDQWIESFCDLVNERKPVGWAEEKGQISAGIGPALISVAVTDKLTFIASSFQREETRR
jgi:hypothetical protein